MGQIQGQAVGAYYRDYGSAPPEYGLWAEVLKRAVEDFKTHAAHRADPVAHPVTKRFLREVAGDGSDPEYWFFADRTGGFEAICEILNVDPEVIRTYLRRWMRDKLGQ